MKKIKNMNITNMKTAFSSFEKNTIFKKILMQILLFLENLLMP